MTIPSEDLGRRLGLVLESVSDGITIQDRAGRVVFANVAAARLCGLASSEELLRLPPAEVMSRFEVLDLDGEPFRFEALPGRRVLAGEDGASTVLHARDRRTARQFWVHLRASAVLGDDGKPELAINIWHDVTVERRHEESARLLAEASAALGSSLLYEEMLATMAKVMIPSLADWCTFYLHEKGQLREVSVANDTSPTGALAKEYRERFPPDPTHPGGVWAVVRTGQSVVHNDITEEALAQSTSNPEARVMLQALGMNAALIVPVRVRDRILGALALVSADTKRHYDDTAVALVEELARRAGVALENAQLYAAAQEAARVAEEAGRTKDEFLATISHELRTPLNAIVGWASVLRGRVDDASISRPLEVIQRNAEAQVRIIDDVLDVSRIVAGKLRIEPKSVDFGAIVHDAIDVIRPSAAAKDLAIDFVSPNTPTTLFADPERLQQVVWNLLSNAVKFTPPRGSIRVDLEEAGESAVLRITDTGKGIDPRFLPHVFERFRQADASITRRVGGLGLGLALVRYVVEVHGGEVHAASEGTERGATFTVTLPLRSPISAATLPPPRVDVSTRNAALKGTRVLVIDDEADARDLIAVILGEAGATVETACSAAEGFAVFRRFRPDVLVSDIGMPVEDGLSFMARVRMLSTMEGGQTPSLALTAFVTDEDRARALSAGYTAHINKPVTPQSLIATVAGLATR